MIRVTNSNTQYMNVMKHILKSISVTPVLQAWIDYRRKLGTITIWVEHNTKYFVLKISIRSISHQLRQISIQVLLLRLKFALQKSVHKHSRNKFESNNLNLCGGQKLRSMTLTDTTRRWSYHKYNSMKRLLTASLIFSHSHTTKLP